MGLHTLEDTCEFITDGTHQTPEYCENGGFLFLSSKDVTSRKINWDNAKRIPESLHDKLSTRLSPKRDDILLAKNGTTGVAAIVDRDEVFDVYVSLAVLRPKKTIYPPYLLHAINSASVKRQFDAGLKGIGVPNLHLCVIRKAVVNIPTLEEQHEITNHLEAISSIIEHRKKQLEAYDTLIKARFVEMFGEPISNNKKLPLQQLGEICELQAGDFTSAETIHDMPDDSNPYPCYGGNGIRGYVDNYTQEGDFPIIGRQGALCGNVQFARGKFRNTEHAVLVTPRVAMNRIWLFELLCLENLYRFHTGAAQPGLAVKTLNQVPVPVAPIELQQQYANFYLQVDKSKVAVQKALDEAQLLYDSLMQKYFG